MNWFPLSVALVAGAVVFMAAFGFTGAWLLLRNVDRDLPDATPAYKRPFAEPHESDIAQVVADVADDRPTLHRIGGDW